MTDAELLALVKRYDDAMMAFFERMKEVERRDSRFMATMRKYGLIQSAQALIEIGGEAIEKMGKALDQRARP